MIVSMKPSRFNICMTLVTVALYGASVGAGFGPGLGYTLVKMSEPARYREFGRKNDSRN